MENKDGRVAEMEAPNEKHGVSDLRPGPVHPGPNACLHQPGSSSPSSSSSSLLPLMSTYRCQRRCWTERLEGFGGFFPAGEEVFVFYMQDDCNTSASDRSSADTSRLCNPPFLRWDRGPLLFSLLKKKKKKKLLLSVHQKVFCHFFFWRLELNKITAAPVRFQSINVHVAVEMLCCRVDSKIDFWASTANLQTQSSVERWYPCVCVCVCVWPYLRYLLQSFAKLAKKKKPSLQLSTTCFSDKTPLIKQRYVQKSSSDWFAFSLFSLLSSLLDVFCPSSHRCLNTLSFTPHRHCPDSATSHGA